MMLQVGDVVRIKTGNIEMTIIDIKDGVATCRYVDGKDWNKEKEVKYALATLVRV